ncbi:MAG: hypothetical protein PWQ92_894 [Thermococcaceae archaeon]|nr:hypothetical protein [Thermococcaceae archaeon]
MDGELRKKLWALAWPAIIANIGQTLVNLVDMIMVGQLGSLAIASVGLGGQFSWFMMPIMFAVSTGTLALVARFVGAKDFETAERVLEQSVYLSFLISIPFLFYPVNFMAFAAFSALRGAGDTKTPMKLSLLTNGANVFLNYCLIFGHFGFPRLEVVGAALASGLSLLLAFIVGFVLFLRGSLILKFRPSFRLDIEITKRILRIGIPATVERAIFSFYNFLYISIVTRFGTIALAAHQVGLRVESIAYMPAFGFNVAVSALVGQSLGEGKPEKAEKVVYEALKMVSIFMGVMGIILIVFPRYLVMPFVTKSDPNYAEVLRLASIYLIIVGISEIPLGWIFVLSGALRGAGDTKSPMYVTAISKLLFRIIPSYILGFGISLGPIHVKGMGVIAAWLAMTLETFTTALFFWWIFKRGKWKYIKV